jgi:hypothetical protein
VRYRVRMSHVLRCGLILLVAVHGVAADTTVFRKYAVGAADPVALEQVVRRVVGELGQVTLDPAQQSLLVLAPEEMQARVAAVLEEAVPAAVNVRLDVSFRRRGSEQRRQAGVEWEGGLVREEGITHTTLRLRPRIEDQRRQDAQDVVQTLVVANGREGSLRIGESVPQLAWIMDMGWSQGLLRETFVWDEVGSFLVFTPWVLDDGRTLRVRVQPELRGRVDGHPRNVRFAAAATELVVQDGQPFPLGGLRESSDFYERFLVGVDRGGREDALDISITAHILPP